MWTNGVSNTLKVVGQGLQFPPMEFDYLGKVQA